MSENRQLESMIYGTYTCMLISRDLKRIVQRRDPRFDGRFYFGVKTTRIYCRPVCPAKPKFKNIVIFRSSAEAEMSGFRACLRCRPDLAPGHKLFNGTLNSVSRALKIIESSIVSDLNVEELSDKLGMTSRHLRRLFDQHLGASPIEIMTTRRVHFAKQLIEKSTLPLIEIAHASGFGSLRRFNEVFQSKYRATPSSFRLDRSPKRVDILELKIPFRAPYNWTYVLGYLRRHETYGIEKVLENSYIRFIPTTNGYGSVSVECDLKRNSLTLSFKDLALSEVRAIIPKLKFLFDTDHNPADLPRFRKQSEAGVRVIGSFDPFETAVSIILSQLVSTKHAKYKLRQLVEIFGRKLAITSNAGVFEFPTPEILVDARLEQIGLTRVKSQAIRSLAKLVCSGELSFNSALSFDELEAKLLAIKGVGDWTASLIAMRCMGNPDAFPKSDLIVQRALKQHLVKVDKWISSRAYLTHYIWCNFAQQLTRSKLSEAK